MKQMVSCRNGEIVDEQYNPEDEFLNIDRERYYNEKYYEIMQNPNVKQMYNELVNTMQEAWDMLPGINRHYKYQLPQQRDDVGSLFVRNKMRGNTSLLKTLSRMTQFSALGGVSMGAITSIATLSLSMFPAGAIVGGALGAVLGFVARNNAIFEELTSITETDTSYNEDFSTRSDGTEIETIPIRWVKRGTFDPSAVSTDLLKSVTQFYEMALNYKTKLDLSDMLENIEFMVHGGFAGSSTTDQESRIKSLMSTYLYGRKKTGISRANSTKMSNFEKKFSKLASQLMSMTHAMLLPWNFTSISKNFLDSMCSFLVFIGESFMHPIDVGIAIKDMSKELFNGSAFNNIFKPNSRSFTAAAMQYAGVANSVGETFEDLNINPIRRFIQKHFSMGPFTFIDYTFKGLFTNMTYNTYRLIEDPNTGKKVFVNKEEAKDLYRKCAAKNNNPKLGYKAWKNSDVRLRNAYYVDNKTGELKKKPKYEDLLTTKLENRISGLIKSKTSIINGMLDDSDKNKASTNFIGALLLQMRGWMVAKTIDATKDGRDFAKYSEDDDVQHTILGSSGLFDIKSKYLGDITAQIIQNEDENYRGIYNPATGYIERGWWRGWSRLTKNVCNNLKELIKGNHPEQILTQQEKRQVNHLGIVLGTLFMIAGLSYPISNWYEKAMTSEDTSNTEKRAAAFTYTTTTAAYAERISELGPLGFGSMVLEIVNSPIISNTYFKSLNSVVDLSNDAIVFIDAEINGKDLTETEPYEIVKRGSFTDLRKYQRDILKTSAQLPYINKLGIMNAYKSLNVSPLKEKEKFYRSTIPQWWFEPAKANIGTTVQKKPIINTIGDKLTGKKETVVEQKKSAGKKLHKMI